MQQRQSASGSESPAEIRFSAAYQDREWTLGPVVPKKGVGSLFSAHIRRAQRNLHPSIADQHESRGEYGRKRLLNPFFHASSPSSSRILLRSLRVIRDLAA